MSFCSFEFHIKSFNPGKVDLELGWLAKFFLLLVGLGLFCFVLLLGTEVDMW